MGNRRSIRLPQYDYSSPGAYFVTICTHNRRALLAEQHIRKQVRHAWHWLPERFRTVELDEFVIMPDHIHFLVQLNDDDRRGGQPAAQGGQPPAPTLADIVGAFKTVTARSINALLSSKGHPVWQRNYYEHVVRDEHELCRIREYIRNNPLAAHDHASADLAKAWEPE